MYTFIVLYATLIVVMTTILIVLWGDKFIFEKRTWMRAEIHRQQRRRSVKTIGLVWLLMVLVEADQLIHMLSVSRDFRLFWLGFFSASWLFITALMIVAYAPLARQMQEKRRQRLQRKDGV